MPTQTESILLIWCAVMVFAYFNNHITDLWMVFITNNKLESHLLLLPKTWYITEFVKNVFPVALSVQSNNGSEAPFRVGQWKGSRV